MSYCLNPTCPAPAKNLPTNDLCGSCGRKLAIDNRYRAQKLIGRGGFGRTFTAIDASQPDRPICVIKQFNFLTDNPQLSQAALDLFYAEAQHLQTLGKHPQIPELLDYFDLDGQPCLVQEFIDGENLEQELAISGAFDRDRIHELLLSLLPVLDFLHHQSPPIIHRDIKPANIIRRHRDGCYVLVDFGAVKQATQTMLAQTGTAIGSAEYTAPEQARGKPQFASDIYSLGVTCIHLLTNVSPFETIDGDNQWVWRDWLQDNPVDDRLAYILDRMVAPKLSQRYQSADRVLADLHQQPSPPTSRSISSILAIPATMLGLTIGVICLSFYTQSRLVMSDSTPSEPIMATPTVKQIPVLPDYVPPPPATAKTAMTWRVLNTMAISGKQYALFGSDERTNAYRGDAELSEVHSLLCIKKSELPFPTGLANSTVTPGGALRSRWSGAKVTIVPDVPGNTLTSQAIADEKCRAQGLKIAGEDGFKMAEFHDGGVGAGWDFWAEVIAIDGLDNPDIRYWVSINDQPANPW